MYQLGSFQLEDFARRSRSETKSVPHFSLVWVETYYIDDRDESAVTSDHCELVALVIRRLTFHSLSWLLFLVSASMVTAS